MTSDQDDFSSLSDSNKNQIHLKRLFLESTSIKKLRYIEYDLTCLKYL